MVSCISTVDHDGDLICNRYLNILLSCKKDIQKYLIIQVFFIERFALFNAQSIGR